MEPLRVMTFNLRYGTAEDGDDSWPNRRDAALEVIRSCKANVLCLQEALPLQIEAVREALPEHSWIGVGRDDGVSLGEFAPIFYSRRLRLADSGTFWLSPTPDLAGSRYPGCFHPRICTWALLEDGPARFAVFNLHLDNEVADSRNAAVRQVLAAMPQQPTVLAGDFNATEEESCIRQLTGAGWRESFREVNGSDQPGHTYHGFGTDEAGGKIDYLWVNSGWEVLEARVVRDRPGGRWPSDHYPLLAVLKRNPSMDATVESVGQGRLRSPR